MLIYLGLQNGQPVATSQIILEAGVAGVYNVAPIPKKRRQGIGGMITLLPLLEARARGYRVGILHASRRLSLTGLSGVLPDRALRVVT